MLKPQAGCCLPSRHWRGVRHPANAMRNAQPGAGDHQSRQGAGGASSGVMVRDADSGTVLYQAHAQQRRPASNMKMFTSLAAFGVLGRITGLKPGC